MRKLKLVRVVIPEIVAYMSSDSTVPEYECKCGMGVAAEYKCCPYCGAELVWGKVRKPSKDFREMLKQL